MGPVDIGSLFSEAQATVPLASVITAECIVCRETFTYGRNGGGQRRKTCSEVCHKARQREREKSHLTARKATVIGIGTCLVCSQPFPLTKYNYRNHTCSRKCGWALANPRAHATRIANTRVRRQSVCTQCGKTFLRGRHSLGIFCSRKCNHDARRIYPTKADAKRASNARRKERLGIIAKPKREAVCPQCNKAFSTTYSNKVYCSTVCAKKAANRMPRPCVQCGKTFTPATGKNILCGEGCRRKQQRLQAKNSPNRRVGRALEKVARRAILKSAMVERVDPVEVFSRDRWICQLCHKRTPKKLKGTNDLRAPTLDHITPLVLGGDHSYRNCQCACRDCNNKKSAKLKGQLRLFG